MHSYNHHDHHSKLLNLINYPSVLFLIAYCGNRIYLIRFFVKNVLEKKIILGKEMIKFLLRVFKENEREYLKLFEIF